MDFIIPSSFLAKTTASTKAEVSAIGPAYMTPSIPRKNGKDHDQRQQEKYLSCKGHDDTKLCLADRGEKSGRHRLYPIGKSHQHKDAEIFFRKLKIQIVSVSEYAHDLMWEELEADKKYHSDNSAKCYGTAVSLTHTAVFLGSVIKAPDGLGTLGDSDADSHKYLVDF